jgi:competence protein ComEC
MDLAWLAAPWILGILWARCAFTQGVWAAVFALVGLGVGGWCFQRAVARARTDGPPGLPWLTGHVVLPAGALLAGLALGAPRPGVTGLPPPGLARIEARVVHVEHAADGSARSTLDVRAGARLSDGATVAPGTVVFAAPYPLPEGAVVRLLVRLAPRVPFRNPSPHPPLGRVVPGARAWLPDAGAVQVLERPWLAGVIEAARNRVRAALLRSLPAEEASIARALVLGDGRALDEAQQARVRGAGLSHVLAVSGLHVVIVAGLLWQGLTWLLLWLQWLAARSEPRRIAAALAVPAVLAFAGFAGGAPSAWRAALTGALALLLVACGRRPDAVAVTSAAVMALSAAQPDDVSNPGFLLSVAATAAILTSRRDPERTQSALAVAWEINWRTTTATAPLVLYSFGHVPLPGLLANLVLVPFASLWLLPAGLAHALVATLAPALEWPTGALFGISARAFEAGCDVFAGIDTTARLPPPDLWQGLLLAVGCCALLLAREARTRVAWLGVMLVCIGVEEWRLRVVERPLGGVRVTFLDVGQGDAALVDLPDGSLMLVDAGGNPGGGADPGERVLVPLLRARRRDAIDLLVLTHPHPDHYGGMAALVGQVPIREIWDSGQGPAERELSGTAKATAELLDRARGLGSRVRAVDELCGRVQLRGRAALHVLAPCPGYDSGWDANDNSLVLRVDVGRRRFLFTGDVEAHGEARLVEGPEELRADVLKVPHHGSRTSSSAELLAAVQPTVAVVSVGASNGFGHPHAEVMERLRGAVRSVLTTAEHGGVVVTTDGAGLEVETWSGD